jgi:AAA+ ATPase superfamily predicted ATPase
LASASRRGQVVRNPFQYGSIVGGAAFCNRERERADLRRALENGEKLFVYSERRLGKTSLVQAVLDELPPSYAAVYVDLWATDGEASFAVALAKALTIATSSGGTYASCVTHDA